MEWFQNTDAELFRFINHALTSPILDRLMPFASGNAYFNPALLVLGFLLFWKGGKRGRLCLIMLAVIVPLGDNLVGHIKNAIGRDRPFLALSDVHLLVGKSGSFSMPSGHAANWFCATMVAFIYYRRSVWVMLPMALMVSFSRIYNGVHYPGDVLAGAALGAGFAVAALWLFDSLWGWAGRTWFPIWWERTPSLVAVRGTPAPTAEDPEPGSPIDSPDLPKSRGIAPAGFEAPHASLDAHWLRLGYLSIAVLLVARLFYIGSKIIQLSEDEAYQWIWSKHLALSYYSKPPLIAYTQFLGTSLWGDNAFGVRFFAPIISAIISLLMLRFFARELNARAGFFLVLIATVTPLASVGAVLMTVDPLSVLFWTAAMLAGWRAVQANGRTTDWLWVGLWMGLGFLSKYTELLQLLCWAVFFILWPPARKHLKKPGPYLALLVNLLCTTPVLIWNSQHAWITVTHVAENAGAGRPWQPTLRYFLDFIGAEFGLLNPVFFVATVWAVIVFWKRQRRNPHMVYFFSMGAPLFLVYILQSFRSRVLPNWIAPAVLPLLCMMVVYWDARARLGVRWIKPWLTAGILMGAAMVILCHDTNLVRRITSYYLPVKLDPLHRVREWDKIAAAIDTPRQQLLSEGKPVFIIADNYGLAGELTFYLPEAKTNVVNAPVVYYQSSVVPENQFYFWPGYTGRKGDNAIYVRELNRDHPDPEPIPEGLQQEFETVVDLGITNVMYHDTFLLRPFQLFACRGVR
jgi:4-amino-4-deoxy-L-arabinose transferase-like glycosyltransferase/membrane-associated phospholipid phosphatase